MYIGGARMTTMYPMSIIMDGMGINFTCVSYAGNIDFGATIDPALFVQPWAIIDGLHTALEQYLALTERKKPGAKRAAARKKAPAEKRSAASKKASPGTAAKAKRKRGKRGVKAS